MSLMFCTQGCGTLVDTDAHPESFCQIKQLAGPPKDECLCVDCREQIREEDLLDAYGSPYYG